MDIVHHTLIGGAAFLVAASHDYPVAGAMFVMGSVFPDLDVFFMLFGKRFYLRHHQGITHSLPLSPLYAMLLSLPLLLLPEAWSWLAVLAAWAGLVLHVLLDWFNTFRIALLAPLSKRRYSLDAVFFIDSVALLLTAAFYGLYAYADWPAAAHAYPLLFAAYFAGKWLLRRRVAKILQARYVIPSALNPFAFYILAESPAGLHTFLYNALSGKRREQRDYALAAPEYYQLAERSLVFEDMRRITRAFHITAVTADQSGTEIHAADLAIRNFGGRFGKTLVKFDAQGKLIHEMANI
jgi:membrane-bound metal-dependent hydrolase YbcI (DUF457 family)